MPITFPVQSSTSTAQTVPTVTVWDYILAGGVAQANVTVRCILDGNAQTTISPATLIEPLEQFATTDSNGYFSFSLVPTDNMSPANCTYTIITPFRTYQITVPSGGPWQSTAFGIIVNTPVALAPAVTGLTGPLTISSGGLTVSAGGASIAGGLTLTSGVFSIPSGGFSMLGPLTLTAPASQLIPGATSFSVRDTGNANDNLLVSNAGLVTARAGLVATAGGLTVSAGGAAITGNAVVTGTLTSTSTLTVSAGGLLVTGNSTVTGTLGVTALLTAQAALTVSAGALTVTAGTLTMGAAASQVVPGATSLSLRNHANGADNLLLTDAGLATLRNALSMPPTAAGTPVTTSYGTVPVLLDTQTPNAVGSFDFVNPLPSAFRSLEIEWDNARGDTAAATAAVAMRFNNDSGANYDSQYVAGIAAAASAAEALGQTSLQFCDVPAGTATANYTGSGNCRIPGYSTATGLKVIISNDGHFTSNAGGSGTSIQRTGKWRTVNTAITRITVLIGAGNISGTFRLWGRP